MIHFPIFADTGRTINVGDHFVHRFLMPHLHRYSVLQSILDDQEWVSTPSVRQKLQAEKDRCWKEIRVQRSLFFDDAIE